MIGAGLAAGFVFGGRVKGLTNIKFKFTPVLFISLVVAILPFWFHGLEPSRRIFSLVAYAGVLLFLVINIAAERGAVRAGLLVITLGWALNFIVIAANRGMPMSLWAYAKSGQTAAVTEGSGGFYRIVIAHPGSILRPLGDVIPVRAFHEVLSIGDCVLMLGVAVVIASGMHTAARHRTHAEQPAQ
jgi:hypothetical protein